jgi:archaellum component FlaF (FlaF/FlaG flagellin family)
MENRDLDNFFESYLDIDSWAEKLEDIEYAVQSRRKKRLLQKRQEMGTKNKNYDSSKSKVNGRKIRNGTK